MQKPLLRHWQQYCLAAEQIQYAIPTDTAFLHAFWKVMALSDYCAQVFCTNVEYPHEFYQQAFNRSYSHQDFRIEWSAFAQAVTDESSLMQNLRRFRHKAISRIIWRELLSLCTFAQHLEELSALADVCVQLTVDYLYQQLIQEWGIPCNEKNEGQHFVVLAVGKLGASELNLSSDIDLIFTYPEEGMTQHQSVRKTNDAFFTRIGQQLIKVLTEITADGFVYRVDMRLRPHGKSGKLVMNFDALENYYQYHGREWERYALIKARPITGTEEEGKHLLSLLQPFVYRRYLDYGAFDALREMRELVANEVKRRRIKKDLKQGPGGIRQIEFLVQAFQLIRGGQNPQFQHRQLMIILARLAKSGYLAENVCNELEKAYLFLRRCEHVIQMMHDSQTHQLPRDPTDRSRLYYAMNYQNWTALQKELKIHTARVLKHFDMISATPNSFVKEVEGSYALEQILVWSKLEDVETLKTLEKIGYKQAAEVEAQLLQFKNGRLCQGLKKHARERLDKIMPLLIIMLAKKKSPLVLLTRMLRLMQAIGRRSAYLALLLERPQALSYLINIVEKSEWILEQLCSYPVLLDELLSPPRLHDITDKAFLANELEQRLNWLPTNDLEAQMDHLRQFKLACFMHLATFEMLTELSIDIPLVLNDITEIILAKIYDLSLNFMITHYHLRESVEEIKQKIPFGIIAYGKLGARELNYASDLDLVFLYNATDTDLIIGQEKNLTSAEFSLRLAQRIIHMLSTHTSCGTLYEVDVRLRPGGSAGLLVSPFDAFSRYLHQNAWTFEHQAIVKARMVIGPKIFEEIFEKLRATILCLARDDASLRHDIVTMRDKLHEHHFERKDQLKITKGGLSDIDFIVQYHVLRFARMYPSLLLERSTLKIIQQLMQDQLIEYEDGELLVSAYSYYQFLVRRKILQPEFELNSSTHLMHYLQSVCLIWDKFFQNV
ncbi:MAG: hypothetical protein BGO43_06105 [Gammaproteobacteria bacterium 39-13]|nr:MAG: hypothetical protein BGO43_06105 [Gammaproteobacteria bacterium 39-13]